MSLVRESGCISSVDEFIAQQAFGSWYLKHQLLPFFFAQTKREMGVSFLLVVIQILT